MKFSYLCANAYGDLSAAARGKYPYPPAFYDPQVGARSLAANLAQAKLADDLGFDWVSVSEHHYGPGIIEPNAIVFAAALTQVVKRAKIAVLGPIVSVNNPVRIAEEIALLDMLSGGRVVLFLLRGTANEYHTYFVNPTETRARSHEAIKLIQQALTEPQPFGWEGRYFKYPTVAVWPRPTQSPHPPIFSSGNSPETATFSAREHFGLAMSFMPPPLVAQAVALYKEECRRAGWMPAPEQIIYRAWAIVTESAAEAEKAQQLFGPRAPAGRGSVAWGDRARALAATNGSTGDSEDRSAAGGEGYGLGRLQFCGTPDMLVEQIKAFYELTGVGVLDLILTAGGGPLGTEQSIRLFAREVMPRVRHLGRVSAETPELAGVAG